MSRLEKLSEWAKLIGPSRPLAKGESVVSMVFWRYVVSIAE